jgi:hypothetical protein
MANRPLLSVEKILAWAEAHRARTGSWPSHAAGAIREAPGETWSAINAALCHGGRGLPGGSSLARLLTPEQGPGDRRRRPALTEAQVLAWADAHRARTGRWPTAFSGPVAEAPDVTWRAIDTALGDGLRGLPGGDSLSRLLDRHRKRQGEGDG